MPYHAETIVVGCGNILFKDDGFGPFVIHKLEEYLMLEPEQHTLFFLFLMNIGKKLL